jgi:hypothetical protein
MRTVSPELEALLGTRNFVMADLFYFKLTNGTELWYTAYDKDLTTDGHTYSSELGWTRTKSKLATGLGVNTLEVELHAHQGNLVNGTPVLDSIALGVWDGAQCTVRRAFMASPLDAPVGTLLIFSGWIGHIPFLGRIKCQMEIVSKLALLNVGLPKALFGPGCRHVLYDPGCTLSRASFQTSGTVQSGSTASVINTGASGAGVIAGPTSAPTLSSNTVTGVSLPPNATYYVVVTYVTAAGETVASPESSLLITASNKLLHVASPPSATGATGWNVYVGPSSADGQLQNGAPIAIGTAFDIAPEGIYQSGIRPPGIATNGHWALGVIQLTSGANAGFRRVVDSNDGSGVVSLRVPLPFVPEVGDGFTLTAGCDHKMSTCLHKFSNLIHFGGEPFIPVPEMGA